MPIDRKILRWYAVYTKSRFEKKVLQYLKEKGIEVYVPLEKRLRQWSDRKKWVEEPLIRCYAFVRIIWKDYREVLNTHGVVRFVYFLGKPAPIPDDQIQTMKDIIENKIDVEVSSEFFKPGVPVEIIYGPLKGRKGEFISFHGKKRVQLKIDYLNQCLLVDISPAHIQALSKA
ncbi:MAG: UpxY family transcription antiterminator [Bacteroidia bacterium]|nr:UpxY family transcription antiterminator [Bacteroidia bacterium]